MRRHTIILGLSFLALAAFSVAAGWTFFSRSQLEAGWRSLGPIQPYVAGGLVLAAVLAGGLFWLAFHAARYRNDHWEDT